MVNLKNELSKRIFKKNSEVLLNLLKSMVSRALPKSKNGAKSIKKTNNLYYEARGRSKTINLENMSLQEQITYLKIENTILKRLEQISLKKNFYFQDY